MNDIVNCDLSTWMPSPVALWTPFLSSFSICHGPATVARYN